MSEAKLFVGRVRTNTFTLLAVRGGMLKLTRSVQLEIQSIEEHRYLQQTSRVDRKINGCVSGMFKHRLKKQHLATDCRLLKAWHS